MRLGIIGAGSIARAHLEASIMAGFTPVAICGRKSSERAKSLCLEFQTLNYYDSVEDLLTADLHALAIITPPSETIRVLVQTLKLKIPILVEKPVAIRSHDFQLLEAHDTSRTFVGYNRRNYSSVQAFKKEVRNLKTGLVLINIPELSWSISPDVLLRKKYLIENATHILDLVNYIFGAIKVTKLIHSRLQKVPGFTFANFETQEGILGSIALGFGVPDNLSIKFWSTGLVLELNPIEEFSKYTELEIKNRNSLNSIKKYEKKKCDIWQISQADLSVKPGFLEQYREFRDAILDKTQDVNLAKIQDAKLALAIAEEFF